MLTRTQTRHQVINHIIGCDHLATDEDVELAVITVMNDRANGERISTKHLCHIIDDVIRFP